MADTDVVVQTNSEGNEQVGPMFPDAPVVKSEVPDTPEGKDPDQVKMVPPTPANADEGEVVRTAGPSAEATLEANVGIGRSVTTSGIADGALGQHTKGENEPVDAMEGVKEAVGAGIPGGTEKTEPVAEQRSSRSKK